MFSKAKNNIVITIGSKSTIIANHSHDKIDNKFLIPELNDDIKNRLNSFFQKNKNIPIYILLDTSEQSYRRKSYPKARESIAMIERDMRSDHDRTALRSYTIIKHKGKDQHLYRKLDALLVSSTISDKTSDWLNFIYQTPNRIAGIYMIPIETCSLANLIDAQELKKTKEEEKAESKKSNNKTAKQKRSFFDNLLTPAAKVTNNVYCFTIQTRSSGFRQIVIYQGYLVFTRMINFNIQHPDFVKEYDSDTRNTFEYLRRILPQIAEHQLRIINILPKSAIAQMKKKSKIKYKVESYTSNEMAEKLGITGVIDEKDETFDILISRIFFQQKKNLRFSNAKIIVADRYHVTLMSAIYLNFIAMVSIILISIAGVYNNFERADFLKKESEKKIIAAGEMSKYRKSLLQETKSLIDVDEEELEKIIEIGKVYEVLNSAERNPKEIFKEVSVLSDLNIKLNNFSISLTNKLNQENPSKIKYKVSFGGNIFNKTGDLEDFFSTFDKLDREMKKTFSNYDAKHSKPPSNLDFTKKYYDFPVNFNLTEK